MPEPAADLVLRRATAGDAPAVRDLFCAMFRATFGHGYPPADLHAFLAGCTPERFVHELTDPDHACMLAEDGQRLMGYATLGPQDLPVAPEGPWWVLRQLYLDTAAQGQGLGRRLLDWAIGEARGRGFAELYLTVWVENRRARRLYEGAGFEEVGHYPFRVGSVIDDDRILRLRL